MTAGKRGRETTNSSSRRASVVFQTLKPVWGDIFVSPLVRLFPLISSPDDLVLVFPHRRTRSSTPAKKFSLSLETSFLQLLCRGLVFSPPLPPPALETRVKVGNDIRADEPLWRTLSNLNNRSAGTRYEECSHIPVETASARRSQKSWEPSSACFFFFFFFSPLSWPSRKREVEAMWMIRWNLDAATLIPSRPWSPNSGLKR